MIVFEIVCTFSHGTVSVIPVHIPVSGTTEEHQIKETFKIFFEEWKQETPKIELNTKPR